MRPTGGAGGGGGATDPFLWLELSGIVWTRARAVDGLWQALVDRVDCPHLQVNHPSHKCRCPPRPPPPPPPPPP